MRTHFLVLAAAALGVSLAGWVSVQAAEQSAAQASLSEKPLAQLGDSTLPRKSIIVSPDGRHVAWLENKDGKWHAVIDGKAEKEYDDIGLGYPVFSPSGGHYAYVAFVGGGKIALVVDGKEGKIYDASTKDSLTFSRDGSRVGFIAWMGKDRYAVVDGTEYGPYDNISSLSFSPDGKRNAFAASRGGTWMAVVDGKESKKYDDLGLNYPMFSPDSQRVTYVAVVGNRQLVVVDDKEGKLYTGIAANSLMFSPDSKHIGYVGIDGAKRVAVIDNNASQPYDDVGHLVFAGDHYGYRAKADKKWMPVIDGQTQQGYEDLGANFPIFSADGRHWLTIAFTGNRQTVVVDGKEMGTYDDTLLGTPLFSPDGNHVGLLAKINNKWTPVLDGKTQGDGYSGIQAATARFSPDGRHFAFVAMEGSNYMAVLDGRAGRNYGMINGFAFLPGTSHLLYLARTDNGVTPVVDNQETKTYDLALPYDNPLLVADGSDAFHFVAMKGNDILLVNGNLAGAAPAAAKVTIVPGVEFESATLWENPSAAKFDSFRW